jgi:hypothetical protein
MSDSVPQEKEKQFLRELASLVLKYNACLNIETRFDGDWDWGGTKVIGFSVDYDPLAQFSLTPKHLKLRQELDGNWARGLLAREREPYSL